MDVEVGESLKHLIPPVRGACTSMQSVYTYDQNVCAFSLSFYIFKIAEKLYEGRELGLERFEYVAMHVL